MKAMHESAGLRVVLCSRPECAHAGDPVPAEGIPALSAATHETAFFLCAADVLVMDRRVTFGLPCAAFALRSAARQPG